MATRVVPLGSGSRGNATLVEFDDVRVLVDAGFSARDLGRRLEAVGVEPSTIRCILLSHEHHDHCRGAERFSVTHRVPVACSPDTLDAMNLAPMHLARFVPLRTGTVHDLGPLRVDAFPIPHNAADPIGFVVECSGTRVGIVTDLGHPSTLVIERLKNCHVLVVESNYDEEMLWSGPYPWQLKQRVSGRLGHLSNAQAASVLRQCVGDDCEAVVVAHVSEKNNRVDVARRTAASALAEIGQQRVQMRVASQRKPTAAVIV